MAMQNKYRNVLFCYFLFSSELNLICSWFDVIFFTAGFELVEN